MLDGGSGGAIGETNPFVDEEFNKLNTEFDETPRLLLLFPLLLNTLFVLES